MLNYLFKMFFNLISFGLFFPNTFMQETLSVRKPEVNHQKIDKNTKVDFCRYIKNIEINPKAQTPRLTVRQFIELRAHVLKCKACDDIVEKVLKNNPRSSSEKLSKNIGEN